MTLLGIAVGSIAGGYFPSLFGIDDLSLISILGSVIGAMLGIWTAYRLSR
jgi:uncharacterized membrane protein YeaQ/YmgE (transglycosylase-associated protein family)